MSGGEVLVRAPKLRYSDAQSMRSYAHRATSGEAGTKWELSGRLGRRCAVDAQGCPGFVVAKGGRRGVFGVYLGCIWCGLSCRGLCDKGYRGGRHFLHGS